MFKTAVSPPRSIKGVLPQDMRLTFRVLQELGQCLDLPTGDSAILFQASRSIAALILAFEEHAGDPWTTEEPAR